MSSRNMHGTNGCIVIGEDHFAATDELAPDVSYGVSDVASVQLAAASGENWYVMVEHVVSIHIMEMRTTSAAQSRRALEELLGGVVIAAGPAGVLSQFGEVQTVALDRLMGRPGPLFFPATRAMPDGESHAGITEMLPTVQSRLKEFVQPVLAKLADLPERHWRQAAIEAFGSAQLPKSPWADAIGPLYTLEGISAALHLPTSSVMDLARSNSVFSIMSAEGNALFPVFQLRSDGAVVRGLKWILSQLTEDLVDRYTLAAWLNSPKGPLGGETIWSVLRESDNLPTPVASLVEEYLAGISQ